jgi:hypothetical protein
MVSRTRAAGSVGGPAACAGATEGEGIAFAHGSARLIASALVWARVLGAGRRLLVFAVDDLAASPGSPGKVSALHWRRKRLSANRELRIAEG